MGRAMEFIKQAKEILDEIGPQERAVYDELLATVPNAPNIKRFLTNASALEDANDCLAEATDNLKSVVL
jgi:hypothetical protein